MVSKSQNKEAQASKAKSSSKAQVEEEKSTQSKPSKRMRFASTSEKDSSTATFVEEPKSGRVPLVDKKWTQIPKDVREQIWEAVQMSYVIGDRYKEMVLSSAAKKWKDFKYNVTKHYILPFAHDKEKLKETPALYKFIEKSQWDAFVASRLTPDFEAKHAEQKERREKLEYNHRLSRKGYVGLEDHLIETMPDVEEIDRAVIWKKAREDKTGNIPDPKVAEKAKIIDLSNLDMPPPLLALCQHVQTKLLPIKEAMAIHMPKEVFGVEHDTFLLPEDILQFGSMVEIGTTVISVYMRGHWVMVIVRPATETAYYMNSLPKRMVDDDMKNIFEKKKDKLQYKQEDIDEVRHEWAAFVNKQLPKDN
ncbi:hypothetical protein ACE6H2_022956 [Prunus campanulata]